MADGLQWILTQYGITHILHYLDDFIFVAASMGQAMRQKHTLVSNFQCLGVPLEQSKLHSRSVNWPDIPGYSNQHRGSITTYTSPPSPISTT